MFLQLDNLSDVKAEDVYAQNGFSKWTDGLKVFVEREFNVSCTTPGGYNNRSVQFEISYDGVKLDVDLLVSPYWNTPAEFYNFLRRIPKEKRSMYDIPTIP